MYKCKRLILLSNMYDITLITKEILIVKLFTKLKLGNIRTK